jgi:hypothetical protein
MEEHNFKNVDNCFNANIYSYSETLVVQSSWSKGIYTFTPPTLLVVKVLIYIDITFIFSTSVELDICSKLRQLFSCFVV